MLYNQILKTHNDIINIGYTLSLLNWDQSTYIPDNGHMARSEQIETLSTIAHDMSISDIFYEKINNLIESTEFSTLEEIKKEEIKRIKDDVEKARKIPTEIASELAKTTSIAMATWQAAKKDNDDKEYLPYLKKIVELKKKIADLVGYEENPYDALLDDFERGLKYGYIKPVFKSLKDELKIILESINNSGQKIDDDFFSNEYNTQKQWDFGFSILKKMGIDFNSFRQDTSVHPFTTTLGIGDVRITTDISKNSFKKGLFSTVHEGGHALYELGAANKFERSPFAHIDSLSLHESQSRFFENIICRSYEFWSVHYKELQNIFHDNLKSISLNNFYRAINKVEKSPIRIESDEVTYNLHIILRTELENAIMNDEVDILSINEAWNEKSKEIFGYYPDSKCEGYLQDIHWSDGLMGYFPTYTMGNLISAQFYNAMQKDIGRLDIIDDEAFKRIHEWFDNKLYSLGSRYTSVEIIKMVSKEELNPEYFVNYLKEKFLSIYR